MQNGSNMPGTLWWLHPEVLRRAQESVGQLGTGANFEQGDQVFLRKSGLNTKLSDSWEGPYQVLKRNTPLSYKVSMGDRVLLSMHIQLLKAYVPRPEPKVGRVTSVLEPDTPTDYMEEQYSEAVVTGCVITKDRQSDIQGWVTDFSDILTKEPGLSELKQFHINTGDHAPIQQKLSRGGLGEYWNK